MKIRSIKDLSKSNISEYVKQQIRSEFTKIGNRNTHTSSNLEQFVINKQVGKKKGARFNNPVRIHIITYRCRETDHRAVSEKALVDSLVKAGILKNDSKEEIPEEPIVKVVISDDEKTKIIIEEI